MLSRDKFRLLATLRTPPTLSDNILSLFSEGYRRRLEKAKRITEERIERLNAEIDALNTQISGIHDIWPGYPPDWRERQDKIRDRDNYSCTECGVEARQLHLHHRRPIRQGGTHRLDNLVLLCAECHSEAHGGKEFKYKGPQDVNDSSPNALEKKIALINKAIADKKDVQFRYKKPDGTITSRAVTPKELRKLSIRELRTLVGPQATIEREGRLCMFGYCHLRQEKRTFAVDRIYKLTLKQKSTL